MGCASQLVKTMMDNVLRACSPSSKEFLLSGNTSYWTGDPRNFDLYHLRNTTKKFLFDYEEDFYNKNIANNPDNRYYSKDFSYTLDEHSFRKYNLDEKKEKIFCYGCSNTFGFGLSDDETWPYLLSHQFDSKYYPNNFGLIGGSADTISRLVYQTTLKIKPKSVFILFPGMYRKEFVTDSNRVMNFNVATANGKHFNNSRDLYYKDCQEEYSSYLRITNPNESFFNFVKNFKFIESILKDIPFIWGTTCKMLSQSNHLLSKYINVNNMIDTSKFNDIPNNYARDGEHYSYNYNEWVAEKFYDLYKKIYL